MLPETLALVINSLTQSKAGRVLSNAAQGLPTGLCLESVRLDYTVDPAWRIPQQARAALCPPVHHAESVLPSGIERLALPQPPEHHHHDPEPHHQGMNRPLRLP